MAWYAGVDLGATNAKAVVADDRDVVGQARRETPRGPTGIAVTEAVLATLREACRDAGIDPGRLRAVGIGSIGPLDLAEGTVEDPANLPDAIETVPLVGPVEELVGHDRVYLHNDTNAGVIGERFYADRNPDDMVYLTISSGIGAGVAVDGRVLSGWDANAGEIGHVVVDPGGEMVCGCGTPGHWEAYCSGSNLPRYAAHLHETESIPTELSLDAPDFGAKDLYEAVEDDPLAAETVERATRYNAIGVATVIQAYAPLVIYVGGAVARHNETLVLDPLRERVPDLVMSNVPDIRLTTLGDTAVVRGALASALTGGTGDRADARA